MTDDVPRTLRIPALSEAVLCGRHTFGRTSETKSKGQAFVQFDPKVAQSDHAEDLSSFVVRNPNRPVLQSSRREP